METAFNLTFTVLGKPETAGSKKGFYSEKLKRVIITDDNKDSRNWKNQVAEAAFSAMGGTQPIAGPLEARFTFYRQRPKGHYGSGKNADKLKASAPAFPATKPDVLKLARAVEDAMKSIVYPDDSQIVKETIEKVYGMPERVEVCVRVLD